ncbi:unnamed protein product [Closterium sp. NIES-64]|nr:unnamed protein product [Closterium sp. NIES-64]
MGQQLPALSQSLLADAEGEAERAGERGKGGAAEKGTAQRESADGAAEGGRLTQDQRADRGAEMRGAGGGVTGGGEEAQKDPDKRGEAEAAPSATSKAQGMGEERGAARKEEEAVAGGSNEKEGVRKEAAQAEEMRGMLGNVGNVVLVGGEEGEGEGEGEEKEEGVRRSTGTTQGGGLSSAEAARLAQVPAQLVVGVIEEARRRQQAVDEALLEERLTLEQLEHERAVLELQQRIQGAEARVEALRAAREREREQLQAQAERVKQDLTARHERALQDKEEEGAAMAAEAGVVAEARAVVGMAAAEAQHTHEVERLNLQLAALHEAFRTRSEEERKRHAGHSLAMLCFALEDAALNGTPLALPPTSLQPSSLPLSLSNQQATVAPTTTSVSGTSGSAGENAGVVAAEAPAADALVDAVLASLPPPAADQGVPTPAQLRQQLTALRLSLSQLGVMPPQGAGVVAHALAFLAAMIKLPETGTELPGGGVEAAVARAEALMQGGQLQAAAEALEGALAGTKAEELGGEWAQKARDRAVLEQAVAVTRAHAATVALSLS